MEEAEAYGKGGALTTKTVNGSFSATKAVDAQGKGGVFASKAVDAQGKGRKAVDTQGEGGGLPRRGGSSRYVRQRQRQWTRKA